MSRFAALLIPLLLILALIAGSSELVAQGPTARPSKPMLHVPPTEHWDIVLVHGLSNVHQWSNAFVAELVESRGGRVFVAYTSQSSQVSTKVIAGSTVTYIGSDAFFDAGYDSVEVQAVVLADKLDTLQAQHGLSSKYSIIAHSMGGLVSRRLIYLRPNTVAGLVTLGTPHHGSPLASDFAWAAFFIGAFNAILDLDPAWVDGVFNVAFPVLGAPLYGSGKVFTVQGDADFLDAWGVFGELQLGWQNLGLFYGLDSDGAVPHASTRIDGAVHIADFWAYDHLELVTQPVVAKAAAEVLP
jgi:pimeloyl-ACP methyl ester carboxylesterase